MTRIYHNPRCSKSRAVLDLLEARGIEPEVVRYLETPPDADTLRGIAAALGCSVGDFMRKGEALYRELGIADGNHDEDAALIRLIVDNPVFAGTSHRCARWPCRDRQAAGSRAHPVRPLTRSLETST